MTGQLFERIKPNTLRDEVVDMIRDAIVSGELRPGEHLKENVIADQMAISRSPIREALHQLEQEGLIVSIPNRGRFVKDFDEKDIREIFTLRAALESLACELITEFGKLQPSDFEQLEDCINGQREAVEAQDFDRLTELDMRFHEHICTKAGHERLWKVWQSLHAQLRVVFHKRFRAMPDYVPQTAINDHQAILEALRQRDVESATQLNKEINARVAEECIQIIHSGREEQGS